MADRDSTRRQFLRASGAVSGVALSGCAQLVNDSESTPPDAGDVSEIEPLDQTQTATSTASPTDASENTPVSGSTDQSNVAEEKYIADGYPSITLNWAYHHANSLPRMTNTPIERIPDQVLQLHPISVCSPIETSSIYEEYQTRDAAKKRLELEVGDAITVDGSTLTVSSSERIEGYPNDWYLMGNDSSVGALTRAGGLVTGGLIPSGEYLDPLETLKEQIRTHEQPEGAGLSQVMLDTVSLFADRYRHHSLDLPANNALQTPMEEFSQSDAIEVVTSNFDFATEEIINSRREVNDIGEYPVDAYESFKMNVDDTGAGAGRGAGSVIEVTSWISREYATEYAQSIVQSADWTFDPDYPDEDDDEPKFGRKETQRERMPFCGFTTENGMHRFHKVGYDIHANPLDVTDIYSGNVTIRQSD